MKTVCNLHEKTCSIMEPPSGTVISEPQTLNSQNMRLLKEGRIERQVLQPPRTTTKCKEPVPTSSTFLFSDLLETARSTNCLPKSTLTRCSLLLVSTSSSTHLAQDGGHFLSLALGTQVSAQFLLRNFERPLVLTYLE